MISVEVVAHKKERRCKLPVKPKIWGDEVPAGPVTVQAHPNASGECEPFGGPHIWCSQWWVVSIFWSQGSQDPRSQVCANHVVTAYCLIATHWLSFMFDQKIMFYYPPSMTWNFINALQPVPVAKSIRAVRLQ